jgi:hypothetical protein
MRTRGSVVATACSKSHFSQLEMGEERIPFLGGEIAVLRTGPLGPAAGDERPMVRDHILGIDRGVSHRCVHSRVATNFGRDVRGQSGANGIGCKDSPEIVGRHSSDWPAAVIWAACEVATRHSRM